MDQQGQSPWTETGFVHPRGEHVEQVRELLRQATELTVSHLSQADQHALIPDNWRQLRDEELLPSRPTSSAGLLEACQTMLQGSMNPAHPRYLGHMDPLPSVGSVIASIITAAVNNNLLSWEMSPIFTELEVRLLKLLAEKFGLPAGAGGIMQSGGSLCNLHALTIARNKLLSEYQVHQQGMMGLPGCPVLFASEQCHSSIQKAAMILGLGTDAVIPVGVDAAGKMSRDQLHQALKAARAQHQIPFAIVATAGTTITGNIDPLPEIAELCREEQLWFHVDASYGGAMIFSEQEKHGLQGIEHADSITFNPQKWCYVTKANALVLYRNLDDLKEHFQIPAPYMSLNESSGVQNLGEWSVQGTRSPDIAKWWLTLLEFGQSGLGELVDHTCHLTRLFQELIDQRDFLEVATNPEMNLLCFRDLRGGDRESERDALNRALQQHLLQEHQTFFSLPVYQGARWLKAVLLNPFTTVDDFLLIMQAIDNFRPN